MNALVTTNDAQARSPAFGSLGVPSIFNNAETFENAQRVAKALAASTLVPEAYRNNLPNCLIALETAKSIGASPLMVMQNLNVIHGRPSWSSQFIIAALNSCGRFTMLRFRMVGEGNARTCMAYTTEIATGEVLEGPESSIAMAIAEGWHGKSGSKWKTMPELMLRYRAAAFFGRLYAPDVLMGMHAAEEVEDVAEPQPERQGRAALAGPAVTTDGERRPRGLAAALAVEQAATQAETVEAETVGTAATQEAEPGAAATTAEPRADAAAGGPGDDGDF